MKKRMAIISSYFEGESYGLLGPQIAATIIQEHTDYECIVIAVTREDNKSIIKKALADYFGAQKFIIAFSTLSGREDLFSFAGELKDEGAFTILAGPQAKVDYLGEVKWREFSHRFKGFSKNFTFAVHGPAEQAIALLNGMETGQWQKAPGMLFHNEDGEIVNNPKVAWNEKFLREVRWDNIYRAGREGLAPIKVTIGQVLQQIGCPHAAGSRMVDIDYPVSVGGSDKKKVGIHLKGCSFCDVASDKGFYGELSLDTVMSQISCLPEDETGRKIPFELINENPLPHLPRVLREAAKLYIRFSRINLILRADWFLRGEKRLRESLEIVKEGGARILIASMGFEAFDDTLLNNFHKGLDVSTNLNAVRLMRELKDQYPEAWAYSRTEGAIHGLIHPTPWDTSETLKNTQKNIAIYGLSNDILPQHSTPLIIHHASFLGDWVREVEKRENIQYKRLGSIIGWWEEGLT